MEYALHDSFILDLGATCYVCNDRKRFRNFRPSTDNDSLFAGESVIPIKGFGTVLITVKTTEHPGERTINLHNVILISSFHTNVASLRLFMAKSVYWDTELGQLVYRRQNFAFTPLVHNQFVLEYRSGCYITDNYIAFNNAQYP